MLEPSETLMPVADGLEDTMAGAVTTAGLSLLEMSEQRPTLVVFLRHSGCPFCIEAMADVARQRRAIEQSGVQVVLAHMGPEPAGEIFEANGVGDLPRISDPEQKLYRAFGLRRGNLWQLGGPKVWWRVFQALSAGRRVGRVVGDAWQMPG
ncbi:MAG: redoxin domain-containing protein, partial [Planctomycetota bacterium]|nr:redoxin domain-containing protein [Planctomycetota bacterium]